MISFSSQRKTIGWKTLEPGGYFTGESQDEKNEVH